MMARAVGLLACGMNAALLALPAQALQVEGLSALEPVVADAAAPVVEAGRLRVALAPDQELTVTPWPAYLPQRFGTVALSATRLPHPAGPIDHLSFSRAPGTPAWLKIANGARTASPVVGSWQLQLSSRGWTLAQGRQHIALRMGARPVTVAAGGARWCVYLLDATQPQQRPGVAVEQEAFAAWAALRLDARRQRCPAPPAARR
ncbi:MAG TPA: hypothetical protein VJ652_06415 [Noviherbaspirillum sp.]|nr:hypothetical protein [Noviherbaspirillum sp.]